MCQPGGPIPERLDGGDQDVQAEVKFVTVNQERFLYVHLRYHILLLRDLVPCPSQADAFALQCVHSC